MYAKLKNIHSLSFDGFQKTCIDFIISHYFVTIVFFQRSAIE